MPIDPNEAIKIAEKTAKFGAEVVNKVKDGKLTLIEVVDLISDLAQLLKYAIRQARD